MPAKSCITTTTATLSAALTFICLGALSAGPGLADVPRVAIIIDGSGSMGQDLSGRKTNPIEPIKINVALDVARAEFENLATARPPMEISLMAFGLGGRKDCTSVDVLVQRRNSRETGQVPRLNNALARIRPNGMTPIAFALEEAARELRHDEPGAVTRIILITDGEETCRQNPCVVARSLGSGRFDVDVHLIGFATTAEDQEKLNCICEETGGQCFWARNGEELERSLGAALDAASRPSSSTDSPRQGALAALIRQPKPVIIEARFQGLEGSFPIRATGGDQGLGDVYRINTGSVPASVATIHQVPRELSLEPGSYVVGLKLDGHRRDINFTVDDSSTKRVIVTFPPARLKVSAVSTGSGELVRDRLVEWRVDRPELGSNPTALSGNPTEVVLPKGSHRVQLKIGNQTIMSRRLPLLAGQTKQEVFEIDWRPRAELAFAIRSHTPQLFASSGALMPSMRLERIDEVGNATTVTSQSGPALEIDTHDLEPGRFRLIWQYGGDRGREEFVLEDGDKLQAQLDLAPGTIFADISSKEAGADFEIENLLTGEKLRLHSSSGILNATVPPGPYRVTASRGEFGSSKELVVHGGAVARARIDL